MNMNWTYVAVFAPVTVLGAVAFIGYFRQVEIQGSQYDGTGRLLFGVSGLMSGLVGLASFGFK